MTPTTALLNPLYPGATPAGTEVKVLALSGPSVLIRVGKKTVKVSPAWLDWPESPRIARRGLRAVKGML